MIFFLIENKSFLQIENQMESNHRDHGDSLSNQALLNSFIELHRSQLELSGVPNIFYSMLFHKLQNQVEHEKYRSFVHNELFSLNDRFSMPVNISE